MVRPKTVRKGPATCTYCGGPMPPVAVKGPPAIYCKAACRKAAYEARRRSDSGAFEVKIVTTERIGEHPLSTCVEHAAASSRGLRRMLEELTLMVEADDIRDQRWVLLEGPLLALEGAIRRRDQARRVNFR